MEKQIAKLNREYNKLNKEYVALDKSNDDLISPFELEKNYERMDEIQSRMAQIANELENLEA